MIREELNVWILCRFWLLKYVWSFGFFVAGLLRMFQILLLKYLLISYYAAIHVESELLPHLLSEAPFAAPVVAPLSEKSHVHHGAVPSASDLPLPVTFPFFHRRHRKHFAPHRTPTPMLPPAHAPHYGSFDTSSHPPSANSPRLSKPSMQRKHPAPISSRLPPRLVGISPLHSNAGSIPSGLAQPPLSPDISGKIYSKLAWMHVSLHAQMNWSFDVTMAVFGWKEESCKITALQQILH